MRRLAAALLLAACAGAFAQGVVVEQPRPFGHVIGDVLVQRVLLPFEPAALPTAARVGVWLERRAPRIETGADGRRWLVIEHQLINAPKERAAITLPALELKGSGGTLTVPAWTVGIVAIAASASAPEASGLRPDRNAPFADADTPRRQALLLGAAAAGTLLAWALWWAWRNRRDAAQRPFARAWRALQRADDASPAAWQALHAAFDATAGRVLHGSALGPLFERRPEFAAQRAAIERFYAASADRFFGGASAGDAALRPLCRELLRIERRSDR